MLARPKAFWPVVAYNIINFLAFSWFVYWAELVRLAVDYSPGQLLLVVAIIVIHAIKLMALALLTTKYRYVYYWQIIAMLLSVISWLMVINYVPEQYEFLLIGNMVIYTYCFFAWLKPEMRRWYEWSMREKS